MLSCSIGVELDGEMVMVAFEIGTKMLDCNTLTWRLPISMELGFIVENWSIKSPKNC